MKNKLPTPYSSLKGTYGLLPISVLDPVLDPGLLLAALLALFAIVPLLAHPGLPNTADGPAHLMRQVELNQAWQDGILYPRWAPDLAYGYGMPLFNYAPPLLYHVTQILHLTGLPLDASMKGTIILMMILYSVGMYLFARDLFGPRAGLLAAAVYLYAPYRLREATIQGNYGQFCGLAFYPLILWSFRGLVTTTRFRYLPLAALSLAGLLLSHNISAMLFAPLFGVYLIFLLVTSSHAPILRGLAKLLTAIVLGLGLSAFFWLPALGERDLIRLAGITRGFFDFRYNFISLAELLALPRPLDLSAINPYYPLSLGLAQNVFALLALLGLGVCCVVRSARRVRIAYRISAAPDGRSLAPDPRGSHAIRHALFFAVALLVTAFLTLPYSQPVWEAVPLLELAEFPWRWLGAAALCTAVLAGAALYLFERLGIGNWELKAGGWGLGVGLVFTLAASLVYLFPAQFIPWGTPTPADAVAYEAQSGAIGTTSTGEFLPRWADRYPSPAALGPDYAAGQLPTKLDPASLPEGAVATTLAHTARETRVAVSSPSPFLATFRALYWPGWRVIIERPPDAGEQATTRYPVTDAQITRPDGLIRAQLPAGEYHVSLRLFATPIRRLGAFISVLSLAAFAGLSLTAAWRRRAEARLALTFRGGRGYHFPRRQALLIGAALIAGLLITRPLAGWFRVQSALDHVYGAQHALRADFGDQVRLLAFDLPTCAQRILAPCSQRVLAPSRADTAGLPQTQAEVGGSLPVVLYWRALAPLATDYSVFVHLDAPDGRSYAIADERHPNDIPTSHWPPSLYLRNLLTIALPSDLPPIRYTLTAGLYDPQSGARLPVTAGGAGDALPLARVWLLPARPLDEGNIPRRLDYRLGDQITLLGYDLTATTPATLTLYWRASAAVETGYTVFIHALDADGEFVTQFDAPPLSGLYPTDAWLPGQIVADAHTIALPETVLTLAVGLYDPNSLARMPVNDGAGQMVPDDAIKLQVAGNR